MLPGPKGLEADLTTAGAETPSLPWGLVDSPLLPVAAGKQWGWGHSRVGLLAAFSVALGGWVASKGFEGWAGIMQEPPKPLQLLGCFVSVARC